MVGWQRPGPGSRSFSGDEGWNENDVRGVMALEKTLEMELLFRVLGPVKVEVDAAVVPLRVRDRSQLKLSSGGEILVDLSLGKIH